MTESINTLTEVNTAAPEGHDQAMIDKVNQKEAELANVGNEAPKQNEKILGKFESTEDLIKAYQELERKQSQGNKQEETPKDNVELTEEAAAELLVKSKVDVDSMAQEFYTTGGLSDKSYEILEKAGIPRAYVDQYIQGVEAQSEQLRNQVFSEIGGQENFQAMASWAAANLTPQELSEYNALIDSGDLPTVRNAVLGLAYRYSKATGTEPKLVGGSGGRQAANGFESVAQLTEAMKDPRYIKDPAYRKEVEARLAASNIL